MRRKVLARIRRYREESNRYFRTEKYNTQNSCMCKINKFLKMNRKEIVIKQGT